MVRLSAIEAYHCRLALIAKTSFKPSEVCSSRACCWRADDLGDGTQEVEISDVQLWDAFRSLKYIVNYWEVDADIKSKIEDFRELGIINWQIVSDVCARLQRRIKQIHDYQMFTTLEDQGAKLLEFIVNWNAEERANYEPRMQEVVKGDLLDIFVKASHPEAFITADEARQMGYWLSSRVVMFESDHDYPTYKLNGFDPDWPFVIDMKNKLAAFACISLDPQPQELWRQLFMDTDNDPEVRKRRVARGKALAEEIES